MPDAAARTDRTSEPLRGGGAAPWLLLAFYPAAGYPAIWLPWKWALQSGRRVASNPVDGMQPVSLVILFAIGLVGGLSAPRWRARWAMLTMAALPVVALVEMAGDSSSHNLFPMEVLFYAFESLFAVAGAALGRRLRQRKDGAIP